MIIGSRRNILINVPSGSSERKHSITIQSSQIPGASSLVDFPMLITLDHLDSEVVDAGANSAQNGGGDLIFTSDEAGTTRLSCEIVNFVTDANPANRRCQVWVKIPSLSATSDTTIYVWYKNAVRTQPASNAAFGSESVWTNYNFYSHDGRTDSTGNYVITEDSAAGTVSFLDDTVCDFNGSSHSHYIDVSALDFSTVKYVGCWAQQPTVQVADRIMHFVGGVGSDNIKIGTGVNSGDYYGGASNVSTSIGDTKSQTSANITAGTWTKCVLGITDISSAVSGQIQFYTNNVAAAGAGAGFTAGTNNNRMAMGSRADKGSYFLGYAGQFWFTTSSNLNTDYLSAEYNNQSSPGTFATAGTPVNDTF